MKFKFKVGDKVRVCKINNDSLIGKKRHLGDTFTIREIYDDNPGYPYSVRESCIFCWNDDELELVTEHATNEKIVITVDGKKTLARLYKDGKVVKSAEARCCPEDTFDFKVGANLAYERLMDVHVVEEVPVPVEPPKPKYYSGKVVCVKGEPYFNCYAFTVGKVYEFKDGKVIDNNGMSRPGPHHVTALDDEYMKTWCYSFIPLIEIIEDTEQKR